VKKIVLLLLCLGLYGCVTTTENYFSNRLQIGMTKNQVYHIIGYPTKWIRQVNNGKIYENWHGHMFDINCDFVDGVLAGWSWGGIYHSKDGVEDVRDYKN
jgi:hypothetical protein